MNTTQTGGYVDFKRFGALREQSRTDAKAALHDVADEFEAMFVETMLKSAHETDSDDDVFGSSEMKTYREMLDGQLAKSVAKQQDFGFEAMLTRQFAGELDQPPTGLSAADALAARLQAIVPATAGSVGAASDGPARRASISDRVGITRHDTAERSGSGSGNGAVDKKRFVTLLTPHATAAAQSLGVSPRAIVAQAALESGWGRHVMRAADGRSTHNYFGLKAGPGWHGDTVKVPTTEYVGGRAVSVNATFRAYPDIGSAFRDYIDFIGSNPRYRDALAHGADAGQYVRQLEAAGYATDPHYANKITAILSGDSWDQAAADPFEVND